MLYKSTRGKIKNVPFKDVLFSGLAPDGGLYIPEKLPDPELFDIGTFSEKKYEEIAQIILKPFLGNLFDDLQFDNITKNAYSKFKIPNKCELIPIFVGFNSCGSIAILVDTS